MSKFDGNRFKSTNQSWETPDALYARVNSIFHFTRDVCASDDNAKCDNYWTAEDSCLDKKWDGINWMNPPYREMKKFIKKAYDERHNAITVCLVPARTNTKWWHDYCMQGEIYFICGRPVFKGCKYGLPQPLALVVFGKSSGIMRSFHYAKKGNKIDE